jgi:hypothetical protein
MCRLREGVKIGSNRETGAPVFILNPNGDTIATAIMIASRSEEPGGQLVRSGLSGPYIDYNNVLLSLINYGGTTR